jgi:hypothetical protein
VFRLGRNRVHPKEAALVVSMLSGAAQPDHLPPSSWAHLFSTGPAADVPASARAVAVFNRRY